MNLIDIFDHEEPEAVITKVGRWTYHVRIRSGIGSTTGRTVVGEARSVRASRRYLARYRRDLERLNSPRVIREQPQQP